MSENVTDVQVPLPQYIKEIAREAARTVIDEHVKHCTVKQIEKRVHVLEMRFNLLIGAIIGSGALGGAVGALLSKMIGT